MDIYSRFAEYYDELMYDVDYSKWYDFIKNISVKKPKNVLEMACGTGGITEYMAKDSDILSVTAFDISEDMLIEASGKLSEYSKVSLLKQDMKEMDFLGRKFDTVIAACDGMNYITDEEDIKGVFSKVADLLEEGGQFIFDINSYYKLSETIGNNTFVDENEEVFYVWENCFDVENDICEFYLTFFAKEEDGKYSRFSEIHEERAYRTEEIAEWLQKYFKDIKVYCDFTDEESDRDSWGKCSRVFFVCTV